MKSTEMLPGPVNQQPQAIAYTDPLTGLGNRHRMRERARALSLERAGDPAPFTIGIVNLDAFKPINDLFGVDAGDDPLPLLIV